MLSRFAIALIASFATLIMVGIILFAINIYGIGNYALIVAAISWLVFSILIIFLARKSQKKEQLQFIKLAKFIGYNNEPKKDNFDYIKAIIAHQYAGLSIAKSYKTAFCALKNPAILIDKNQEIIALSDGFLDLSPSLSKDMPLSSLFKENLILPTDSSPLLVRVTLDRRPYDCTIIQIGSGQYVASFIAAGLIVGRTHLTRFNDAISQGNVEFRFSNNEETLFPALLELNHSLQILERSTKTINAIVRGDIDKSQLPNAGLNEQVQNVHNAFSQISAQRDFDKNRSTSLEQKLQQIADLVEHHQQTLLNISNIANKSQNSLSSTQEAMSKGNESTKKLADISNLANKLVEQAGTATQQGNLSITNLSELSAKIEGMMSEIEDISFRTNLLALNAAVEAARAGEKGAGFAIVAEEVRTLAKTSAKSSKEIRQLAQKSHEESQQTAINGENLEKIIINLEEHLQNISNETYIIGDTLDKGSDELENVAGEIADIAKQTNSKAS